MFTFSNVASNDNGASVTVSWDWDGHSSREMMVHAIGAEFGKHLDTQYPDLKRRGYVQSPEYVGQMYCLRCRDWRRPRDLGERTLANGASAQTGTCPNCNAKLFKMVRGKVAHHGNT